LQERESKVRLSRCIMPDEKRIIDLNGLFYSDGTYNPCRGQEIIRKVKLLMSFPHDPGVREKLFTQFVTGVNTIRGGAEFAKLERQEQRNMHKASFAGTILSDVFKWDERFPKKRDGVNVAIKRMAEYDNSKPRFETVMIQGEEVKKRLPPIQEISERTLKKYWKKYRCVAHLFAALGHHPADEEHKKIVPKRRFNSDHFKPVNFPSFLALAKMYQDFAVSYIPARASGPLISKDEIWWIEPDFELPSLGIRQPQQIPRWVQGAFRK